MEGFEQINQSTFIRRAPQQRSQRSPDASSTLIVVCSWVAADPKHIAKYTDRHADEHPDCTVLLLRTSLLDVLLHPTDNAQQPRVQAAVEIIDASEGPVVFHVFSNGGTVTASQALRLLDRERRAAVRAVVFDSCPGRSTYRRTAQAVVASAPKGLRPILPLVVYLALLPLAIMSRLGVQDIVTKGRARFNDDDVVPVAARRLYAYSKADTMVWWEDARQHASEARSAGCVDVREVVFEKSKHCAHIHEDANKYWGAVIDVMGIRREERDGKTTVDGTARRR
ncbi:hypothetical protein CSOJ01_13834 [Colletotrichum sojae]|uniref:Indole-diterpene biosynthesis protein PaxU n=1 Tax=Colletotrichum sojae TaxID=2175907 RepID=A0A8H6IRB1_9PEZI|nr:hypothetical protein CSOJ01_13834 [Colletotrichum sojae]